MRVAAILHIPDSPFGAVRLGFGTLATAAAAHGDTLDVVTPERFRVVGRLHPRWWVLLVPFAAAAWLWRRRREYDVVIFHSYAGWVYNLLPGRLPTITDFHGLEPLFHDALERETRARGRRLSRRYRATYGWLMPRLLRSTCRRSRIVTCLNNTERTYIVAHGWAPADRVALVRQSMIPEFFTTDREYRQRGTRIVALMQWLETKGTAYLVEAFSALARQHDDVQLFCYGTRAGADIVRRSFPEDVRARVFVEAELSQRAVATAFQHADIFVHPSLSEGSSQAIMQAMASALPMVITSVGLAPDVLVDGRDCLFVPKGDATAIVAAISSLIDDAARRRALGTNARAKAEIVEQAASTGMLELLARAAAR